MFSRVLNLRSTKKFTNFFRVLFKGCKVYFLFGNIISYIYGLSNWSNFPNSIREKTKQLELSHSIWILIYFMNIEFFLNIVNLFYICQWLAFWFEKSTKLKITKFLQKRQMRKKILCSWSIREILAKSPKYPNRIG
jgi:hypothetical protein